MQMPGPRNIVIYWPGPRAFSVVQKPWGWAHILVQKPRGARGGGMVTGQIDTCITSSIQLGYIPTAWEIATLRMLLNPDKLLTLTTSYRPNSLISSIMKLLQLDLPTKMTRWLSDFLVGRIMQVNVNSFFSNQNKP